MLLVYGHFLNRIYNVASPTKITIKHFSFFTWLITEGWTENESSLERSGRENEIESTVSKTSACHPSTLVSPLKQHVKESESS